MGEWHKTGCVMCAQNCGLEAFVENNRIERVRPDKDNPRSEGYSCRKGLNIAYHQHHAQRLSHPLKKTANGFEQISWDQAIEEIGEKLKGIVAEHGPKSFAYMGGGGQGCHFEAAFGVRLLRALGSHYHYNALGQELTGLYWGYGRAFGKQYHIMGPDDHNTESLFAIGWNGWMSHQIPQARRVLKDISKDPNRKLVVIDPRNSETAKLADIHLKIRPGTDALLTRAMIAIVLEEGWQNDKYIAEHCGGFDMIRPWFENFDIKEACRVCELDYDQVKEATRIMAQTQSSMHPDLGILMGRHSTVTTYLEIILLAICGRIGVPGGTVFPGTLMPLGAHSDERNPKTWRTVATDFPAIMGVFPPNAMPEEIMTDHPERLRAVLVSGSNPLRSYADTAAYEEAFGKLDLLVCIELAMTETARLADYVLPSRSGYESWDGTFFPWTCPGIFFQMRRPIVEAEGECLEAAQIMVRLADQMGLIPDIPDSLYEAAKKDRLTFGMALMEYMGQEPKAMPMSPFVLAKTIGAEWESANLAALWGLLMTAPKHFYKNAARAGFNPGITMGDEIFQAVMDHPEGLWIGKIDMDRQLTDFIKTEDGKINLHIPEVEDTVLNLTPEKEEAELAKDEKYPFVLSAGRHMDFNANTLMRDPAWNKGKRACTATMHPDDAAALNLSDGQMVTVVTEAGEASAEVEINDEEARGHVTIPHGFGLDYNGDVYGVNVNQLTKNTNRDPIAGTPLHRYVRCSIQQA